MGTPAPQPQAQVKRVFVDRSRVETYQRCHRLRYLEYHEAGMGITSARKPLPLAVGGSVHEGLAMLLKEGQALREHDAQEHPAPWLEIEEHAVRAALGDFAQYQAQLDIGEEDFEIAAATERTLKSAGDPELVAQARQIAAKGRSDYDQYLYEEQSALVEGLVRAYARRRLRPLLEQYEVLEVEREGSWLLSQWKSEHTKPGPETIFSGIPGATSILTLEDKELWFMSRPDALLLERESKQLYILSFKTAAKWDRRKGEDAKRDMQGLSEGVEVEKRLAKWWTMIKAAPAPWSLNAGFQIDATTIVPPATADFLRHSPSPPRIMGIRYEYMLKGERRIDKDLSARLGIDVRAQSSPLVRAYKNPGMAAGDEQWNISWDYVKEDGSTSKLYYKNWRGAPVFESLPVKEWIDKLDSATMALGEEGREMGFSCQAQATGFLESHPLDALFIPPIVIYRNDDELRDWIEQVEAQEVRIAGEVEEVRAAKDEGEKRHLLNIHFQQTRRACSYPTNCDMIPLCFGGEEIRRGPLESGLYKIRVPNHPQERGVEEDPRNS
jgi:hypothetical protein